MKRVLLIAAAVAVVMAMSVPAWAGTNPDCVFTLHAKTHTTKGSTICTTWSPNSGTPIPCTSYVTNWPTGLNTDVYLVIARGDPVSGLAGVSCGLLYDNAVGSGVDVFGWTLCADLEFTNGAATCPPDLPPCEWPISHGGNRITWVSTTNCQRTVAGTEGVHAVAGSFYLYAYGPDVFELTENKNLQIPELAVANCAANTDYLPWGRIAFVTFSTSGTDLGCNPCTEPDVDCTRVPVEPTTWGKLKTRFGTN
jgi:hypothetical protein